MKRFFDILGSILGLILFLPILLIVIGLIVIESNGGAFYKQERIGLKGTSFKLIKLRSMYINSHSEGLLTIGMQDSRITKVGYFIRKYKIDEFTQLINVLLGDMSLVGPRPEVRKYVGYYNEEQKKVLDIKPGITDFASILYFDENNTLSNVVSPDIYYIDTILPDKIRLGVLYMQNMSLALDMRIILLTLFAIINKKNSVNITREMVKKLQ